MSKKAIITFDGSPDTTIVIPPPKKQPLQAIGLTLSDNIVKEMTSAAKGNNKAVKVTLGRDMMLKFGTSEGIIVLEPQLHRQELYRSSDAAGLSLQFAGLMSHKMQVKSIRQGTGGAQDALVALQQKMAALEREKNSKTTHFVPNLSLPMKRSTLKASANLRGKAQIGSPTPAGRPLSRPLPSAASAPTGPLSRSMPGSTLPLHQDERSRRQRAARIPLLHLLAIQPCSDKVLARKLKLPFEDFEVVLEKNGRKDESGEWRLIDRAYKEVDLWKFRYRRQDERDRAVQNAISAFDRMRLSRSDSLWQKLLPESERGKGTCLSRLDLRKGPRGFALQPTAPAEDASTAGDRTASEAAHPHSSGDDPAAAVKASPVASSFALPGMSKKQLAIERRLFSKKRGAATAVEDKGPAVKKPKVAKEATEAKESKDGKANAKVDKGAKVTKVTKVTKETKVTKDGKANAKVDKDAKVTKVTKKTAESKIVGEPKSKDKTTKQSAAAAATKTSTVPKSSEFVHYSDEDEDVEVRDVESVARPAASSDLVDPKRPDRRGTTAPTPAGPKKKAKPKEDNARVQMSVPTPPPSQELERHREALAGKMASGSGSGSGSAAPRSTDSTPSLASDSVSPISAKGGGFDVLGLARKFQEVWAKYEKLHREVSMTDSPPADKVAKVMKMHDWLAATKKDIYARADGLDEFD